MTDTNASPTQIRLAVHRDIAAAIRTCTSCALHTTRKQAVPGVGNLHARIVIVGEAPGENEDNEGEPFVGRSGKLLNSWLAAAGLSRGTRKIPESLPGDVYILNTVQCRPPDNRDPHPSEAAACSKWLEAQLQLIQPSVVIAVGVHAGNAVTSNRAFNRAMGKLRASNPWPCSVAGAESAKVVCVYHPAYVLRSGGADSAADAAARADVAAAAALAGYPR